MTDSKKLANKEQQSDSAAVRRRKRGVSAAGEEVQRNDAGAAGRDAPGPPRSANASSAASGDTGYLSAEDLKHFREIFKSKVEHDSQPIEPRPDVPAAAAQRPAASADSPRRKRRGRGPQKSPTKVLTSIRLDQEVYEYFRDTGRGWQSRINDFLADKMRREQRSKRRKARAAEKASSSSKSA